MALADFFTAGATPVNKRAVKKGITANTTIAIPAGVIVRSIYIRNNSANAVTGGVRIGTSAAGVDVLAAGAVAASTVVNYAPLIGAYLATARSLYVEAVSAWNSANIDVVITYQKIDA